MTKQVRVGVIGTSDYAEFIHFPGLKSHSGAVVAAVCGRNQDRAQELAKKYDIPQVFNNYRGMIEKGHLDAVVIVAPDNLHYEMTLYALEHKLHVLCEKPLARNATEAREMYEKAEQAGVKHMVHFTWRWLPHYRYMKQLIDSGYIGRPFVAQFRYVGGYARDGVYGWRFDRDIGGGALGDLGAHAIDFARYFVGDVKRVSAHLSTFVDRTIDRDHRPANDSAVLALEFVNGGHATVNTSAVAHLAQRGQEQQIIIHGEGGTLEAEFNFDMASPLVLRGVRKDEMKFQPLAIPDEFWGGVDQSKPREIFLYQSIGDRLFIDSILEDRPIQPSFYDGLKAQEVIDAALLSHETGRWITVPDSDVATRQTPSALT